MAKIIMEKAFTLLDQRIEKDLTLILGGGGCMILAHGYPLATTDVDAIPLQASFDEIDPHIKAIAREMGLPGDWLNPYFSSFTHLLPRDYQVRLIAVFVGRYLKVMGLGREDMLIMKCFAHRPKDLGHARALIKAGVDINMVEKQIEEHKKNEIPQAKEALDFLDDLREEFE